MIELDNKTSSTLNFIRKRFFNFWGGNMVVKNAKTIFATNNKRIMTADVEGEFWIFLLKNDKVIDFIIPYDGFNKAIDKKTKTVTIYTNKTIHKIKMGGEDFQIDEKYL